MKIYYAQPTSNYGTSLEWLDILTLREIFPAAEIYNPNNLEAQEGYRIRGMDYFVDIVKDCDVLFFRAFADGKIPAGAMKEIRTAIVSGILVFEVPYISGLSLRGLDVEETRERLSLLSEREP